MEKKFKEFKEEIMKRAKKANACRTEYDRAYGAENFTGLISAIKDNITFALKKGVIDEVLIGDYREEFEENEVYINVSTGKGYLLAWGNATVEAWGNATVRAWGNAKVRASENAEVRASGNATVRASGNATVEAWDNAEVRASENATVRASDNVTVRASDNVTVRAWDNVTVRASDNVTVRASENATVEASENAYVQSNHIIECKMSGNAIYRIRESNTVIYVSDGILFKKIEP